VCVSVSSGGSIVILIISVCIVPCSIKSIHALTALLSPARKDEEDEEEEEEEKKGCIKKAWTTLLVARRRRRGSGEGEEGVLPPLLRGAADMMR